MRDGASDEEGSAVPLIGLGCDQKPVPFWIEIAALGSDLTLTAIKSLLKEGKRHGSATSLSTRLATKLKLNGLQVIDNAMPN